MRAMILIAAVLAMFTWTTTDAAQHQVQCAQRGVIIGHLDGEYGEVPVAMGQVFNGNMMEVLASPNGSWTIIITWPNGISCMFASGQGWEQLTPGYNGSTKS